MAAVGCAVATGVLGGCAFHAVPFTEPVVGHAMVWEEPSTAFPNVERFALLGFIGDGSEPACRRIREEFIARATELFSRRAGITTADARATLQKEAPNCAPVILRPASPTTANFVVALGRRALFTEVLGWRTESSCRDGLVKMDLVQLQCVPAFVIQVPSRAA